MVKGGRTAIRSTTWLDQVPAKLIRGRSAFPWTVSPITIVHQRGGIRKLLFASNAFENGCYRKRSQEGKSVLRTRRRTACIARPRRAQCRTVTTPHVIPKQAGSKDVSLPNGVTCDGAAERSQERANGGGSPYNRSWARSLSPRFPLNDLNSA